MNFSDSFFFTQPIGNLSLLKIGVRDAGVVIDLGRIPPVDDIPLNDGGVLNPIAGPLPDLGPAFRFAVVAHVAEPVPDFDPSGDDPCGDDGDVGGGPIPSFDPAADDAGLF